MRIAVAIILSLGACKKKDGGTESKTATSTASNASAASSSSPATTPQTNDLAAKVKVCLGEEAFKCPWAQSFPRLSPDGQKVAVAYSLDDGGSDAVNFGVAVVDVNTNYLSFNQQVANFGEDWVIGEALDAKKHQSVVDNATAVENQTKTWKSLTLEEATATLVDKKLTVKRNDSLLLETTVKPRDVKCADPSDGDKPKVTEPTMSEEARVMVDTTAKVALVTPGMSLPDFCHEVTPSTLAFSW